MSDQPGHVQLDADGRIAHRLLCAQCGYDLRTLKLDATCPECGWPVRHTLKPPFDRARWLRRIGDGAALGSIAMALLVVGGVAVWTHQPGNDYWSGLGLVLSVGGLLLAAWAGWALATSDGSLDEIVGLAWLAARCGIGFALIMFIGQFTMNTRQASGPLVLVVISVAGVVFCLSRHMSRVATHLSHKRLALQSRLVGVALTAGVIAFGFLAVAAIGFEITRAHLTVAASFLGAAAIWSVPVLWTFHRRCMQAAKLPSQHQP